MPDINGLGIYPQPVQHPIPIWRAVGGTPSSAYRAGLAGIPMAIAIIGGMPEQFKPMGQYHEQGAREAGHPIQEVSINSHGFNADSAEEAMDIAFPAFKTVMDKIGRERGWSPMTRSQFEASCTLRGAKDRKSTRLNSSHVAISYA